LGHNEKPFAAILYKNEEKEGNTVPVWSLAPLEWLRIMKRLRRVNMMEICAQVLKWKN
jgi:hypothetical protein